MLLITSLQENAAIEGPVVATFGTFDGVHLGHQHIFQRVKDEAAKRGQKSALLTFSNQPSEILYPDKPTLFLTTHAQKMALLEKFGFDLVIDLPFDEHLRAFTAEQFLAAFRKMAPFSLLIVGSDVAFGKERAGNRDFLMGKPEQFDLILLDRFAIDGLPVSSSLIRQKILQGDLQTVKKLLGRPYALSGRLSRQNAKMRLEAPGYFLPPEGEYDAHCGSHPVKLHISSVLEISGLDYHNAYQPDRGLVEITL